jgi:transcriptional regulator with XRE-family HTH domain
LSTVPREEISVTPNSTRPSTWGVGGSTFGARLRAARQGAGLTLREVAQPSGLSLNYLSDLERDVLSNPALEKLRALALTLDLSIDDLLGLPASEHNTPDVSAELSKFLESDEFRTAVAGEARRWKADAALLTESWTRALAGIRVHGRAPRHSIDYLFVFEAARRALEDG